MPEAQRGVHRGPRSAPAAFELVQIRRALERLELGSQVPALGLVALDAGDA